MPVCRIANFELSLHISSSDGRFEPNVIQELAAEVERLGAKLKEVHRKRGGSRASSRSSSRSSVFREELDHLKKELDDTRHEGHCLISLSLFLLSLDHLLFLQLSLVRLPFPQLS